MSVFGEQKFCRCAKHGINVNVDQSEGQCREEHNCDDSACPLEKKFHPDRQNEAFGLFMPQLAQGLPLKP